MDSVMKFVVELRMRVKIIQLNKERAFRDESSGTRCTVNNMVTLLRREAYNNDAVVNMYVCNVRGHEINNHWNTSSGFDKQSPWLILISMRGDTM
ncbi:hypothetical protein ACTXT7_009403 [Hymenolepis weldensis]